MDQTVCLVDLIATVADILGETLPDDAGEDSISNLPYWEGRQLPSTIREAIVHHSIDGSFSIRKGDWKLELCPGSGGWSDPKPGQEAADSPTVQLYDLRQDIGERVNVYGLHPEVVQELTSLLTCYVLNGRSTPGTVRSNTGGAEWEQQLAWLK